MNDERIDALVRRLDEPSQPDPAYATRSFEALLPNVQRARRADARLFSPRLLGRFACSFGIPVSLAARQERVSSCSLSLALLLAAALAIAFDRVASAH